IDLKHQVTVRNGIEAFDMRIHSAPVGLTDITDDKCVSGIAPESTVLARTLLFGFQIRLCVNLLMDFVELFETLIVLGLSGG
ncbi:MAG: hypothetical protein IJ088_06200, partial [Clostridia bacterium]|nr:hypothetical protein [Clostridia bacterium]